MNYLKSVVNKYQIFIKYIFSAGLSFLLDLTLFTIFNCILQTYTKDLSILISTILARIISSLFNYTINKNAVFKSSSKGSLIKYGCLVVIQMFMSSFLVTTIFNLTQITPTIIKIPVECILFLINYIVQKTIIFRKEPKYESRNS